MKYAIAIKRTPRNFSAFAPDLPGCVATGAIREEVIGEMGAAIVFHNESLREHRELVPVPRCCAAVVAVATAG